LGGIGAADFHRQSMGDRQIARSPDRQKNHPDSGIRCETGQISLPIESRFETTFRGSPVVAGDESTRAQVRQSNLDYHQNGRNESPQRSLKSNQVKDEQVDRTTSQTISKTSSFVIQSAPRHARNPARIEHHFANGIPHVWSAMIYLASIYSCVVIKPKSVTKTSSTFFSRHLPRHFAIRVTRDDISDSENLTGLDKYIRLPMIEETRTKSETTLLT
jgi:hypothetical protein